MKNVLRQHAEYQFAEELAELKKHDTGEVPVNWQMSPRSVVKYLMGGKLKNGFENCLIVWDDFEMQTWHEFESWFWAAWWLWRFRWGSSKGLTLDKFEKQAWDEIKEVTEM